MSLRGIFAFTGNRQLATGNHFKEHNEKRGDK